MLDYPTQEELNKIKDWDQRDFRGLVEYVRSLWNDHYGVCKLSGSRVLRLTLITGGWSGNEDVIGALRETVFWMVCWEKSERGGLYAFKINKIK